VAIEYKLKTPIVLGEETIEVLQLEEPTIGKLTRFNVDLSESALSTVKGMAKLILSCSTNVTDAHVNLMKLSDLTGAIGECTDFFN
jgi:hypothetical protein